MLQIRTRRICQVFGLPVPDSIIICTDPDDYKKCRKIFISTFCDCFRTSDLSDVIPSRINGKKNLEKWLILCGFLQATGEKSRIRISMVQIRGSGSVPKSHYLPGSKQILCKKDPANFNILQGPSCPFIKPSNVATFSAILISFLRIRLQLSAENRIPDPACHVMKKTERTFLYTEQQNNNLFTNPWFRNLGTECNTKKHSRSDPDPWGSAKGNARSDLIGLNDAVNGLATNERSGGARVTLVLAFTVQNDRRHRVQITWHNLFTMWFFPQVLE